MCHHPGNKNRQFHWVLNFDRSAYVLIFARFRFRPSKCILLHFSVGHCFGSVFVLAGCKRTDEGHTYNCTDVDETETPTIVPVQASLKNPKPLLPRRTSQCLVAHSCKGCIGSGRHSRIQSERQTGCLSLPCQSSLFSRMSSSCTARDVMCKVFCCYSFEEFRSALEDAELTSPGC